MSSVPTLGYWDFRGLAEPIRYLLRYAGVPFIDKTYHCGPGSSMADYDSIEAPWQPDKKKLGMDFPNLPYYVEGDLKLSQSTTILRYLARKHGLMATSETELTQQDSIEQQIVDMRSDFLYGLMLYPDYKEKTDAYIRDRLTPQLEMFAKYMISREWVTSEFSYVDMLAYETLDTFRQFSPKTFGKFPILAHYLTRFENVQPIKEYHNSEHFKSWPYYGPILQWK